MRVWLVAVTIVAVVPAWADSRFRIKPAALADVPLGQSRCDIRLKVDNEVEVKLRRDTVDIHTISGQDAHNDGSECNAPLPDREVRDFHFQALEKRNDMELVQSPSRENEFAVIVRIHDTASGTGRYHFRLTWSDAATGPETHQGTRDPLPPPRGPDDFSWNNVVNFRGRGQGQQVLDGADQKLADVSVDIDRSGKILVTFLAGREVPKERPRQIVFTGMVLRREESRLKADMATEDHRLRGTMTLSLDDRNNVNSIALEATDGQSHLHLTWDRR
jgi:hypothetical protein